jgi:hypothetical protein
MSITIRIKVLFPIAFQKLYFIQTGHTQAQIFVYRTSPNTSECDRHKILAMCPEIVSVPNRQFDAEIECPKSLFPLFIEYCLLHPSRAGTSLLDTVFTTLINVAYCNWINDSNSSIPATLLDDETE